MNKIIITMILMISITSAYQITMNVTQANASQIGNIKGYFMNGTNQTLQTNLLIEIEDVITDYITTNASGYYSYDYQIPENIISGNKTIDIQSTQYVTQNTTETNVQGKTFGELVTDKDIYSIKPTSEGVGLEINIELINQINAPNNYSLNLTVFGDIYQKNQTNAEFNILVDNTVIAGLYDLEANASWTNDDGTTGRASGLIPVLIEENNQVVITHTNSTLVSKVDTTVKIEFNISSESNTIIQPELSITGDIPSSWVKIIGNDKINPNGENTVTYNITIPYDAEGITYESKAVINYGKTTLSFPIKLTVLEPELNFMDLNPEYLIENDPTFTITAILENKGNAEAKNISYKITCPIGWVCEAPDYTESLIQDKTTSIEFKVLITNPQTVEDKTITLIASDKANRTSETSTKVKVNANSIILTSEQILVYTLYDPSNDVKDYYLLGVENITKTKDLSNISSISRVQRDSSLSTWTVKLGNKSKGIGSVCEVSLIINDVKYDLDNQTARTNAIALVGEVGSYVYEVYQFHTTGECIAHLDYGNGKETITHIIATGTPPNPKIEIDSSALSSFLKREGIQWEEQKDEILQWILLGIGGFFVVIYILQKRIPGLDSVVYHDSTITKDINKFNELLGGDKSGLKPDKKRFYEL